MKNYNLSYRKYIIGGFICLVVLIYIIRLFNIQIVETKYKENALSNAFFRRVTYPARGLIYDRNGNLVVFNKPAYDVMLIPKDLGKEFDTVSFAKVLGLSIDELRGKWDDMKNPKLNPSYSVYTPQKLISQLSLEDYGRLQEKLYMFPGVFVQKRNVREYNYNVGANILGNIREVSQEEIEKDSYYRPGDYTGDLGIEKSYEQALRGVKGEELLMKDAYGRVKGKYENGEQDVAPVSGRNLTLSIDMELQEFGEKLMAGKKGAIVAIEPETGEILALVTSPNYSPSMLVGKERGKHYAQLVQDPLMPLFDRALQGAYPPGSTFKPTQALMLLQEGIISTDTHYPCSHGYVNGLRVGCHGHASPIALKPALQTSCNGYFCWGFHDFIDKKGEDRGVQFTKWKDYMVDMGYGYRLGVDLPHESRGFIPNNDYYNKAFEGRDWSANTVISISIGQGEVLATPLQIANLCATIANRGHYIIPHVVKEISDSTLDKKYLEPHTVNVDRSFYEIVAEGMRMAVTGGTCKGANLPGLDVCGKTGTAQNPHGKDHSAFMGFAHMDNPKIAVAVYVENAGFGATFGVPIGALIIEKYLTGEISASRKGTASKMMHTSTIEKIKEGKEKDKGKEKKQPKEKKEGGV